MKRPQIVGVERGYGPRHAFNAQEGAEAVPTALPSPPYEEEENYGGKALKWVADQVRQGILPDEALEEIKRDPTSLRSIMGYAEAAMSAGTLLSGGEGGKLPKGEVPVPRVKVAPKEGSPEWYIREYAVNQHDNGERIGDENHPTPEHWWKNATGGAYDWAYNKLEGQGKTLAERRKNDKILDKLRAYHEGPPRKGLIDDLGYQQ